MGADEEIYERIKLILSKAFKIDRGLIREDANLESDLGLDSIDLMDAVCFAEKEFKINILKQGAVNVEFPVTVRDLVVLVSQKAKETARR